MRTLWLYCLFTEYGHVQYCVSELCLTVQCCLIEWKESRYSAPLEILSCHDVRLEVTHASW